MNNNRTRICAALCALLLLISACAFAEDDAKPTVIAANCAAYEAAVSVIKDYASVRCLNGDGLADYVPNDEEMQAIAECDLLIITGDEAWAAEFEGEKVVRAMDGIELLDANGQPHSDPQTPADPCVWTAPINQALLGYAIADAAAALGYDPDGALLANAEAYMVEMVELDARLREALADSAGKAIRGAEGRSMAYFAHEFELSYAPDDKDAIELDSISTLSEQTYAERMLANAEKLK